MNNEIYLVSSDGYRDSINLEFYATSKEQCLKLAIKIFKEYNYGNAIKSCDFIDDETIQIIYYEVGWGNGWEEKDTIYVHKIENYVD